MKLKNILFKERNGDPLGSGTDFPDGDWVDSLGFGFQGSGKAWATGSGNKKMGILKTLIDPAEEKEKKIYGSLNRSEPPQPLKEREASDILYRDLPGGLPMNSLANPINHIPPDEEGIENDQEENNIDKVSLTSLIPMPKIEKYGYGPLTTNKPKFESINKWDETNGENIKTVRNDGKYNVLVAPKNYTENGELDSLSGFNKLNDDDDVNTRSGNMANLVVAKKYIPEPAPVYEDKMKAKKSKKFNELENKKEHLPSNTSDKKTKKLAGINFGSIINNDNAAPKNMKNETKKNETNTTDMSKEKLQPYKGSGEVMIDPESFTLVKEIIKDVIKEITQGMVAIPKVSSTGRAVEKKLQTIPGLENLLAAVRGKGDAAVILSQIATALGGDKLKGSDVLKRALQLTLNNEKQGNG